MKFNTILFAGTLLLLAYCGCAVAQTAAPTTTFDPELARSLGADEYGIAPNFFHIECHQEDSQDHPIKQRTQYIDGFNQAVADIICKLGHNNAEDAPE